MPNFWIAVSVYTLVAIVNNRLIRAAPLYSSLQILSLTLFATMPLKRAFLGEGYISEQGSNGK